MRIHIGNIAPVLAENIGELEERLREFGDLAGPLSLHKKPLLDTYFAYCDVDLSNDKFIALKKTLNGVRFKQSLLSIQEARPKWEWKPETEPLAPNPSQVKRQNAHLNKIGVYKGKYRTHERKPEELREITLRLKFPNGVHKVRTHRQRLWGYEKKLSQNLVYEFKDGEWRDLTGRPVEIAVRDEHSRDARVVQDINTGYLSDSDFEEFKEQMDQGYEGGDYYNDDMEVVSHRDAPQKAANNDDSDTDDEFYARANAPLLSQKESFKNRHNQQYDEQEDHDQGFNQGYDQGYDQGYNSYNKGYDERQDEPHDEPQHESGTVSAAFSEPSAPKTETLRDVLKAPTSGFTLFGPADTEQEEPASQVEQVAEPVYEAPKPKFGLFFMHSESPFLSTQAQILKLKRSFDPEAWQKEFYENRGDWNRQLRKRRREEHRSMRKKGITVK